MAYCNIERTAVRVLVAYFNVVLNLRHPHHKIQIKIKLELQNRKLSFVCLCTNVKNKNRDEQTPNIMTQLDSF